jgi:membrane-associated protease RseP (regulator of RpoE activity)
MVRRSWLLLTAAVFMGTTALVSVTGCARAQEEATAQESEGGGVGRLSFAFGGGSYLGVYLSDVDAEAVSELGLKVERGARVESVADESPAAEAGIREDDVIVTWNEEPVESVAQLTRLVRETPAGRTVSLGVMRDGRERDISVTVRERSGLAYAYGVGPGMDRAREAYGRALERVEGLRDRLGAESFSGVFIGRPRLGVSLQNLTPQLGDYFGVGDGDGALITAVREESAAEQAGLKAGDVIIEVAGEPVDGPREVMREISRHEQGEIEITVVRDKKKRTLKATLEKAEDVEWRGSGPHIYLSPGRESVGLDMPHTIVLPEMPDVVIPEVVIPDIPNVEIHAVPASPLLLRGAPAAPVRAVPWERIVPTAL